MPYSVKNLMRLIFNAVILIACVGFFLVAYVVVWLSEAVWSKPKLALH